MSERIIADAINVSPLAIWMVVSLFLVLRGKLSVLNRRCLGWAAVAVPAAAGLTVYLRQTFIILAVAIAWGFLLASVELWLRRHTPRTSR
jgi:hypothetical protein